MARPTTPAESPRRTGRVQGRLGGSAGGVRAAPRPHRRRLHRCRHLPRRAVSTAACRGRHRWSTSGAAEPSSDRRDLVGGHLTGALSRVGARSPRPCRRIGPIELVRTTHLGPVATGRSTKSAARLGPQPMGRPISTRTEGEPRIMLYLVRLRQRLAPGPLQDRPWRLARRVRPPRGPHRRRVHHRHHLPRQERRLEVLRRGLLHRRLSHPKFDLCGRHLGAPHSRGRGSFPRRTTSCAVTRGASSSEGRRRAPGRLRPPPPPLTGNDGPPGTDTDTDPDTQACRVSDGGRPPIARRCRRVAIRDPRRAAGRAAPSAATARRRRPTGRGRRATSARR